MMQTNRNLLPFLLLALSPAAHGQIYQVILGGEDTALHVKSGGWTLDRSGSFHGNSKFSVPGPGTGAAQAVWSIDGIPEGTYEVEFYVDNGDYAQNAEYVVEHDQGVTTVTASQNYVGTGWHPLGSFNFRHAGRITQTDRWSGAGTKVIADALRITLQGTPVPPTVNVVAPEVTVVVDDLGRLDPNSTSTPTYQLFQEAPDFTYAIIPGLTYSTAVLQSAHSKEIETILHQPLQYIGQPDYNSSDSTRLYVGMTDLQILSTLRSNLQTVAPYVKGANNHQGSRFSQYSRGLQTMVGELKAQKLYWYDSRTISDSFSYDIAKAAGILAAERDLFVDGSTPQITKDLILSVANRARYAPNNNHLMICHQGANTVRGLLQVRSEVQQLGVQFVPLGHNLHYIVESDFQPDGASFTLTGNWTTTTTDMISHECADGHAYELAGAGRGTARFTPDLPTAGRYRVFAGFAAGPNNTPAARLTVHSANNATATVVLDQTVSPNRWHYLGEYVFHEGTTGYVELDNSLAGAPGQVLRADAVKFTYRGPDTPR